MAVEVTQDGSADAPRLQVMLTGDMIDRVAAVQARQILTRLLGLEADLTGFATAAASEPALAGLAARMRGLKPPRFATVFEGLVNGVACQQLSLDVGVHLLNRLSAAHGRPVDGGRDGLHAFPAPSDLAAVDPADLKRLGFSMAKARTIVTAAREIVDGDLDQQRLEGAEDAEVLERLTALRGVGRWTAQYVMLRGLGRLEVFPGDDVGARNKLKAFLGLDGGSTTSGSRRSSRAGPRTPVSSTSTCCSTRSPGPVWSPDREHPTPSPVPGCSEIYRAGAEEEVRGGRRR